MERTPLSLPEIAIIGGTRAVLGAGIALLAAAYLTREQRRATGWTLVAVGVLTSIPIGVELWKSFKSRQNVPQRGERSLHAMPGNVSGKASVLREDELFVGSPS